MWDWWLAQELQTQQALVVTVVMVLAPLAVALIRRWRPAFEFAPRQRKLAVAALVTFMSAAAATPGEWWERLIAGVVAVVGSQGLYNLERNRRAAERW
ncbi:MAG: hypothetical protein U9R79_18430 [Armatimonadota bacterium]|nr:hypothetical protein [Armatimonadota bacterium]